MALTLYTTSELLRLPPPTWLIDGIFPERGFVALYGKPGDGKTFIALDMALSIALGLPWQGHATKPGPVVYVSAEGGTGIGKRVQAWLQHRGKTDAETLWLLQPITLSEGQTDVDELVRAIGEKMPSGAEPDGEDSYLVPSLIVVDTLARCFMGDENLQEDMGNFVKAVDRLREEFHAAVLIIHHSRLGADRERGSTAFRGAADTLLRVEKDGMAVTLSCEKQKDAEEFEPFELQMLTVAGTDSIVMVPSLETHEARATAILDMLADGPKTWAQLVEGGSKKGISEKGLNYPLQLLKKRKNIERKGELYTKIGG